MLGCAWSEILRTRVPSHRAGLHGIAQRIERCPGWDKFVSDIAAEVRVGDGARHAVPVELLRIVQLVPAGDAASVEMADVLRIRLNRTNDIALHDLHVID